MTPSPNRGRQGSSDTPRTAADREEARLQRERRRREREGAGEQPGSPEPPQTELEPIPAPPQAQIAVPESSPSPPEEPPLQAEDPDPGEEHIPLHTEEDPHEGVSEPLEDPEPFGQQPPREDRAPLAQRTPPRPRQIGRGALEHRRGRIEQPGGTRGPRRLRARAGALTGLALALALVWFLVSLIQPFHGSGHGQVIVEIPKGSSSAKIGSILQADGVVSSGFFFQLRALIGGQRSDLHSGRFALKLDMSYSAAISALSKPPPAVIPVKVVIPEGENRRQIAEIAHAGGLSGDYLAASDRSRLLDTRRYGVPRGTPDLEGFLFPATYELNAGAPVSRLLSEQLQAFTERFGPHEIARAHALHETPYQLLTVASMVEREAQVPADRPKIAAVIYNRIKDGMPLGIDASIYYAVEQQKGIATYTGELTESDLHIDSPYNTRTHTGLPPTPISNPGMASIEAAAHPAHVPYLYYVAAADGCGEQMFSQTAAQFETDVAAYRTAVSHNGGKPPVCKHK